MSCSQKKFDSKETLLNYLENENNGYIQKKVVNGVVFTLMYKPTDLLVSQSLQSNGVNDIDSLRGKYINYIYFDLSISKNKQEILNVIPRSQNEYGTLVNQFNFGMEKKIHLLNSKKDTIKLVDYIFARTFGLSNSNSFLIVYPRSNSLLDSKFFTLSIEEFGIQTGDIKFNILTDPIVNQPTLSFD